MYGYLWRVLPGPPPVKAVTALLLFALVVYLLFNWVFPWLSPLLPFNDVTVGAAWGAGAASSMMGT